MQWVIEALVGPSTYLSLLALKIALKDMLFKHITNLLNYGLTLFTYLVCNYNISSPVSVNKLVYLLQLLLGIMCKLLSSILMQSLSLLSKSVFIFAPRSWLTPELPACSYRTAATGCPAPSPWTLWWSPCYQTAPVSLQVCRFVLRSILFVYFFK